MKNILKHTVFALIFFFTSASGQEKNQGAILTIVPAHSEEMPDSIRISLFKGIIGLDYERKIITAKKKMDGSFSCSLPNDQAISPFIMYTYHNKQIRKSLMYYAELNDKINIEFRTNKGTQGLYTTPQYGLFLEFTGSGNFKYNIRNTFDKINLDLFVKETDAINLRFGAERNSNGKIESQNYYKSTDFKKYLNSLFNDIQESIESKNDSLLKYQNKLGPEISNYYSYELSNWDYFRFFIKQIFERSQSDNAKKAIMDFYFSKVKSIRPHPTDPLVKYGFYFRFLRNMEIVEELNFSTLGKGYSFQTLFDTIKKVDNIELRDILLTNILVQPGFGIYVTNTSSRDSLVNEALKIVKSASLKDAIIKQKLFSKGSKVYNFSFPDTAGRLLGLNDMKGKVFMIDFSGTGCAHCAIFADKFKTDVYPEFKNNPLFKVISVNIDKKRESWLKAIESGIYTQEGAIELNTGGVGFNHPFLKYYNASSVPFVLLVGKDGRLISRIVANRSSEISEMIRKSLAQESQSLKEGK